MTKAVVLLGLAFALCAGPAGAQVMLDVSKVTCWQFVTYKVTSPKYLAVWLSGFHHGKSGDTVTVPVVTIYRARGELIDDYRVFIDLAPLFS